MALSYRRTVLREWNQWRNKLGHTEECQHCQDELQRMLAEKGDPVAKLDADLAATRESLVWFGEKAERERLRADDNESQLTATRALVERFVEAATEVLAWFELTETVNPAAFRPLDKHEIGMRLLRDALTAVRAAQASPRKPS